MADRKSGYLAYRPINSEKSSDLIAAHKYIWSVYGKASCKLLKDEDSAITIHIDTSKNEEEDKKDHDTIDDKNDDNKKDDMNKDPEPDQGVVQAQGF